MKSYFVKTPGLIKFILKKWIWSFSKNKKSIYLTFDDGPTPEITAWTLNLLQKYKAKATFFCIGKNITEHPKIFQKIISEKHSIGNHTNNHLNSFNTETEIYIKNIESCEAAISQNSTLKTQNSKLNTQNSTLKTQHSTLNTQNSKLKTQHSTLKTQNSKLFRPPYGKLTFTQSKKIRKNGYKIVMWDVLSGDFDTTISKEKCLENVLKHTQNGSIIVFHDSIKASENLTYVLPKVLEYYSAKGVSFKSIT